MTLSAEVIRSDTNPEILVWFKNSGASKATVFADFTLEIVGSEPFIKHGAYSHYIIYPGPPQMARIQGIDPHQFDLVVRAGGGELTLKIEGIYEGIGGPYAITYCSKWITGRDPSMNSKDGQCEED